MLNETVTDRHGVAKLCDAPMEPVDFFVGTMCGQVVIKAVTPLWMKTKRISFTYDPHLEDSCDTFIIPTRTACHMLLRIRDISGKAVEGAHVGLTTRQNAPDFRVSDSYGRVFYVVSRGEKLQGTVTRTGYLPANVSEDCSQDKVLDRETVIVLRTR
jgi:hypothetical protein